MTSSTFLSIFNILFLTSVRFATANIYITEHFESRDSFISSWILSTVPKNDGSRYDGVWELEHVTNSDNRDLSLVTKKEAAHYSLTKKLVKPFDFKKNEAFVFQYSFKIDRDFTCGGAYVKLYPDIEENSDLSKINDKSRYAIMFGPDKCGSSSTKLHFIFQHYNPIKKVYEEKHCKQPEPSKFSHIFSDGRFHNLRLIIRSDNSFQIFLDSSLIHSGSLLTSFDPPVNPPKTIPDPNDLKPSDWDDRTEIDDPEDKKPDDWDESQPSLIVDPDAKMPEGWLVDSPSNIPDPESKKPAEWDDEVDGEWVAPLIENPACKIGCGAWKPPQIPNPKYKGKWFPRKIANPAYKGEFTPKQIPNPDYFLDENPYNFEPISSIGFELWIVSKSVIFDDIFITNDINEADAFHKRSWSLKDTSSIKEKLQANIKSISVTLIVIVIAILITVKKMKKPSKPSVETKSKEKKEPEKLSQDSKSGESDINSSDDAQVNNISESEITKRTTRSSPRTKNSTKTQ